jgi:mono/diheme cytochrome c family protein
MSQSIKRSAPASPSSSQPLLKEPAFPIWLIVFLTLLLYAVAVYFDGHGSGFHPQVYAPYSSYTQLADLQITGPPNPLEIGFRVYHKPSCVSCHQASGAGSPGQFPPLVGSEWVQEPEPGRIIRAVLNGLQGPISVKNQQYNNAMVAWGGVFSDEEIAAVITYIRQNKDWGNNAPAVTADRVKAVREKIKGHPGPFTADELLKIPAAD